MNQGHSISYVAQGIDSNLSLLVVCFKLPHCQLDLKCNLTSFLILMITCLCSLQPVIPAGATSSNINWKDSPTGPGKALLALTGLQGSNTGRVATLAGPNQHALTSPKLPAQIVQGYCWELKHYVISIAAGPQF